MSKRKGRSKSKGAKSKSKGKRGKAKSKPKSNRIPLEVLQNRLGKLSTLVAKRGGKLPSTFY